MKRKYGRWILPVVLFILVNGACAQEQPEHIQDPVQMLDLSGVSIVITQDEPLIVSTPTEIPSPTHLPTSTSTETQPAPGSQPVSTKIPQITPSPTCLNQAEFVKHLSISDNTALKPETLFGKVWLVKNSGTCTWTPEYKLVYSNGELMGAVTEIPIPQIVAPGEMVELRVTLHAPVEPAVYFNEWLLQDMYGNRFGLGISGEEPLRVQIVVNALRIPHPL